MLTICNEAPKMIFADKEGARAALEAVGIALPQNVEDWQPVVHIVHADCHEAIMFECWRKGVHYHYRFDCNNHVAQAEWVKFFVDRGVAVYMNA